MSVSQVIKKPITTEFAKFEELFQAAFKTENPMLKEVYAHVLQAKGKQIRPILTLLSAKLCGIVNHSTYFAAISLELLHSASLIHDDVVDETLQRRGRPSVNSAFNNKVAVLSGDYLLSQVFSYAGKFDDARLIDAFTGVGKSLAEGELLQLENFNKPNFDEDRYLEIIKRKTAILFSTCMYTGAISSRLATDDQVEALRLFGEYLGICFQIKDDIFDYTDSKEIGKPTANDIREKKMTLPLIYAYNHASSEEKIQVGEYLKQEELSQEAINFLVNLAYKKGGIEYAEYRMEEYRQKAIDLLSEFSNREIV
jgi:octaprenyl-diphosphate synthase